MIAANTPLESVAEVKASLQAILDGLEVDFFQLGKESGNAYKNREQRYRETIQKAIACLDRYGASNN